MLNNQHRSNAKGLYVVTMVLTFGLWLLPYVSSAADCVGVTVPNGICASGYECVNDTWICADTSATALQNPLGEVTVWDIFARIAGGLNFVTGTLALFFIVLGGYRILSAAGNSEHFEKGRQMIVYALLGLILTVGSYTILATTITILTGEEGPAKFITENVLVDPLNLRGLEKPGAFVLYGERILGFILSGLGGLSTLMFVYGGTLWLTAAGNEERIAKAKKTLLYATIGLVIVLSSYTFISFVYAPFYSLFSGS